MILSNTALLQALDEGRIVIIPRPEPVSQGDGDSPYATTAVDLRLGSEISRFERSSLPTSAVGPILVTPRSSAALATRAYRAGQTDRRRAALERGVTSIGLSGGAADPIPANLTEGVDSDAREIRPGRAACS